MKDRIIYSLNTEDVQFVAKEELNRTLTEEEIDLVQDGVERRINWYDIIEASIQMNILR